MYKIIDRGVKQAFRPKGLFSKQVFSAILYTFAKAMT